MTLKQRTAFLRNAIAVLLMAALSACGTDDASVSGPTGDTLSADASGTSDDVEQVDAVNADAGCQPTSPPTEVCDGIDNDCNGQTDESTCDDDDKCTDKDTCKEGKCVGAAITCDDGNPCTNDACDKATGCTAANNSAPCDDDNACTEGDTCAGGTCGAGQKVICDDNNPCTTDACDVASGCTATNNEAACDDGDACTGGDICAAGKCTAGKKISCEDGNVCTDDPCDKIAGCSKKVPNKAKCTDGSACTTGDQCDGKGACKGKLITCDDGNFCTIDACDLATGCTATNNTFPCDDGDACTGKDTCAGGKCLGGKVSCDDDNVCTTDSCDKSKGCIQAPNTQPCDDKNACTSTDKCKAGACGGDAVKCDDNNPCTSDSCDKSKGCQYKNVAGKCSDGDACTHKDTCSAGKCAGQKGACNDGNVCTTDACDSKTGCKPKTVKPGPCDDGSKCTTGDKCDPKGACVGLGKNCSDDNSCTLDGCDAKTAKCTHTDSGDGVPCDDGNLCTLSDKCVGEVAGKCIGKATKCDDKESCTNDSCQLGKCVFAKKSDNAFCNDGQTCTTTDRCIGGKCQGKPRTNGSYCTDGNTCTAAESCVDGKCAAGGALKDGSVCSDGSTCTIGDACKSGKCTGQPNAPLCDDENPCTIDVCAPHDDKAGPGGCTHKPLKDGAACDDGNLCTGQDACDKGACKPGKDHCSGAGVALDEPFDCGKPTAFVMDPVVPANQTGWHIDGTPNPPGYASKGCSLNYNDGKSYPGKTKGTATSGLIKVPSGSPTLTFNSYHGVESSSSYDKRYVEISVDNFKTKVSTQLSNSVGKKVWTKNTVKLDAFAGKNIKIRFVFDSVDNISNGTTGWFIDDLLIGLKTLPTVCKIDAHCNDGSPCTVGSCDPKSGKCLQNPGGDGAACNPAYKACTEGGLCKAGVCKALAKDCDDNKPCTTDSCNPKSGECEHVNVKGGTPCDDGNACKPKTFCNPYGSCNGPTINCNDSDGCTYDKCDNNTGCNHVPQPAGTTCDDGNKCTVDQTCKAGKCQTGPLKNCDDNDKCTADSCDKLKGCTYTVIKGCGAPQSLPYSADFQCGSAGSKAWVLTPSQSLGSPGWWGIDGTPSQPKPRSPSCTLNFNDGSDFKCNGTKSSHGTAKSPVINLAGAVKPQIQFYLSGTWRSSSAETLQLQVKEYGQVSWQTAGTYNHSGTSWQLISRNLTAWSGKFIQIRFNFTVSSCYSTTGQGPFIDDLTIKATGCNSDKDCKQDSNPCTNEFCTFTKKCSTQKLSFKSCDDGSTCTTDDACSDGKCLGVQKKCSDGNACTADSCDQLAGCKNVQMPSGAKCEDGNLCTTGDTCQLKLCKAGMPTVCNDKNACTVDTCDPKAGCQHKAALDGTKCGDGECKAGKCGGVGTSSVMYSHTATQLFHLDVAKLQIKPIGKFTFDKFAGNVGDVALNGKGQLLAVTDAHLFLCDASNAKCVWRLKMPTFLNGLTFVPAGMFHPQNETLIGVSPDGGWYRIAWDDLLPSVVKVGSYGSPYKSSGDAVSVPGMGTFATVTGGFVGSNDMLASVNPKTGKVIKIIGQLGAKQLWGLAWGGEALWAFGSSGDVYAVDPKTAKIGGQSKPVPGAQWWGAGSSGL